MIKLSCPSCGGNLELNESLELAFCVYCGAKIILDEFKRHDKKEDINNLSELIDASIESQNYNESSSGQIIGTRKRNHPFINYFRL